MSRPRIRRTLFAPGIILLCTACGTAGTLIDTAGRSAEREATERVDRGVTAGANAIEEGVRGGSDASSAADESRGAADPSSPSAAESPSPGGRTVGPNYDFTRGERALFHEDYAGDNLGDFPRGFELVDGTWDVVDVDGRRWLRGTGGRGSDFEVILPETLPERFTVEYEVMYSHGNQVTVMATSPVDGGATGYDGTLVKVMARESGAWIPSTKRESFARAASGILSEPTPVEVMVDGNHMKVFVNGIRVANVPNAVVVRSDRLHFEDIYSSSPESPIFIGAIRVDAGGRDLYGALERDGRVTLDGIYFDTGSDRLRAESHATLAEVAGMLRAYEDLSLLIEGHTDSQGDPASNLDLSDRRAASVRRYLVTELGIDASRLSSRGLGESQPVATNDTPEGRQQNRRVELVRGS